MHPILQKLASINTPKYPDSSPGVPRVQDDDLAERDAIERRFPDKPGRVSRAYSKFRRTKRMQDLEDKIVMHDVISPSSRAALANASTEERPLRGGI